MRETLSVEALGLLLVPLSIGLIAGLLAAVSWLEQRILAPDRMIVASARSRRAPADHVEVFVAREAERLLRDLDQASSSRPTTDPV